MFTACSGGVTNIYGTPVIPVGPCANCGAAESAKPVPWHARDDNWYKGQEFYGASLDLDHRVPIAVARERGPDEFVRAFLPANLQWLCTDCHVAKTSKDRGDMARLAREHKTRQRSLI